MAFENVFGNVDFMAPVRSEYANQAAFQQMIGQALQNYQAGQDRQLKRKQLEAEVNAPIDVKKVGENALLKLDQGLPVTPQEQAAARFVIKTDVGSMRYNPETMQMEPVPPRLGAYRSLVGGQDAPQDVMQAPPMTPPPMAAPPTTTGGYRPDLPTIDARQDAAAAENMARLGGGVPAPMTEDDIVSVLDGKPPSTMGGVIDKILNKPLPEGRKTALTQSLKEYALKKGVDLNTLDEENKRKLMFEKELAEQKMELSKQAAMPARIAESDIVFDNTRKAISLIDKNRKQGIIPASGTLGNLTSILSESDSGNLSSYLSPIKSSAFLDKLDQMRQSSPTGASGLGQVNQAEKKSVEDIAGEMQITTDPDILEYNLKRYYNKQMDLIHGTPDFIESQVMNGNISAKKAAPYLFRYNTDQYNVPQSAKSRIDRYLELKAKAGAQ